MFKNAVARLTLWYMLALIVLAAIFSVTLYQVSTTELNNLQTRQDRQEVQLQNSFQGLLPPQFQQMDAQRLAEIDDSKRNIAFRILYLDIVVLAGIGLLSYWLAQRTLQPIEESVEAQNRFTADASHELRTPLTAMRTELEVALRDKHLGLAESKALHASTLEEIVKLESLTSSLLQLARTDKEAGLAGMKPLAVSHIITAAVEHAQPLQSRVRLW